MPSERLNETPEGFVEMLQEHIVYELRMLRATYLLLSVPGVTVILNPAIVNAIIESFCGHARLLLDFFECQTSPTEEAVCACHFTDGYKPFEKEKVPPRLRGKLNAQISHLSYNRTKEAERKIGADDQARLFRILENEVEAFGAHLKERYRALWPDDLKQRAIPGEARPSATNVFQEAR